MKTTAFVGHSDCSRHDTGWQHPDHQGRLPGMLRAVYKDMLTLFEPLLEVEAVPAAVEDLLLVHAAEYVERVRQRAAEAEQAGQSLALEAEVVVSGASWQAALAAAGTALTGVETVLAGTVRNAFCAARPPGHQAGADRAGGFSVFNNIAIAARHLRQRRGVERVLVVECGARPGAATARLLAHDAGVRLLSVHQASDFEPVWPARARAAVLPRGADGADFVAALDDGLHAVLETFSPDFVLVALGFDALEADPLGALALQPPDYHALTGRLRRVADEHCGGRLVAVLEGGYEPRASGLALVQHLRALAGLAPA